MLLWEKCCSLSLFAVPKAHCCNAMSDSPVESVTSILVHLCQSLDISHCLCEFVPLSLHTNRACSLSKKSLGLCIPGVWISITRAFKCCAVLFLLTWAAIYTSCSSLMGCCFKLLVVLFCQTLALEPAARCLWTAWVLMHHRVGVLLCLHRGRLPADGCTAGSAVVTGGRHCAVDAWQAPVVVPYQYRA